MNTILQSKIFKLLIVISLFIGAAAHAESLDDSLNYAKQLSSAFEHAAKVITPSVVTISSIKKVGKGRHPNPMADPFMAPFRDFFGDRFTFPQMPKGYAQEGTGTGVIIDSKGHIITNNHLVGGFDEIKIRLHDGRSLDAEIIGVDDRSDLAVVKIKADNLVAARIGNSDKLKIGEWVVAAGNPFGLDNSITAGIVSAKGRAIMGGASYEDFIQTDAAINPGNSGGPLVNLRGEVIGINTAIFSKSGGYMGIGFAIPSNMAKSVLDSLINEGRVVRGWLGVGIQNLTKELAQSFNHPSTKGALVGHIEPDGPASKAGLKQGDIIIGYNGKEVDSINPFRNAVAATKPGSKVDVEVIRQGRKKTLSIKIGELPSKGDSPAVKSKDDAAANLGMNVEPLSSGLAAKLGTSKKEGVVVSAVQRGSLAAASGLQAGDIIVSVNGKDIKTVSDLKSSIDKKALEKGIRMVIETRGMERFVFLRNSE